MKTHELQDTKLRYKNDPWVLKLIQVQEDVKVHWCFCLLSFSNAYNIEPNNILQIILKKIYLIPKSRSHIFSCSLKFWHNLANQ